MLYRQVTVHYKLSIHKGIGACRSLDMTQFTSLFSSSIANFCPKNSHLKDISCTVQSQESWFDYHDRKVLQIPMENLVLMSWAKGGMSSFYLKPLPQTLPNPYTGQNLCNVWCLCTYSFEIWYAMTFLGTLLKMYVFM